MLRKRTDEVSRLPVSFGWMLTSTGSWNYVQVKRSWSVAWLFAYRIETWHALARFGLRQSV